MLYQDVARSFPRRHPVVTAVAVVTVAWWLWQGWYASLVLTGAVALVVVVSRRRRAVAIRNAGLRARAEYEHRLSLAGDPRGVFGRYPPVQAGWHPDPRHPRALRYFDGAAWTPHVVWR
jgi:Protein of unknown function (DUF2510)